MIQREKLFTVELVNKHRNKERKKQRSRIKTTKTNTNKQNKITNKKKLDKINNLAKKYAVRRNEAAKLKRYNEQ